MIFTLTDLMENIQLYKAEVMTGKEFKNLFMGKLGAESAEKLALLDDNIQVTIEWIPNISLKEPWEGK